MFRFFIPFSSFPYFHLFHQINYNIFKKSTLSTLLEKFLWDSPRLALGIINLLLPLCSHIVARGRNSTYSFLVLILTTF